MDRLLLVLSRCADQAIVIGDDIVVTVLDVSSNQVSIGIDAPQALSIDRHEVRERKLKEAVAEVTGDALPLSIDARHRL